MSAGDRTVHAECSTFEIVRYDKAGKWYMEPRTDTRPRQYIGVADAAQRAVACEMLGGTIHTGLPGGRIFDQIVRRKR